MTKNESKLLSLQWIAKTSAFCLLLSAFSVNAAMAAPAPAGTVDEVMAVQQGKKVTGVVVDGTGEGRTAGQEGDRYGRRRSGYSRNRCERDPKRYDKRRDYGSRRKLFFGDSQWGGNRDQLYRLCDTGDHGERTDGLASETDGGHAEDR